MIFSELYSVYYRTVASILQRSLEAPLTEKEMCRMVLLHAFSESTAVIPSALLSGKWQLLQNDGTSILHHAPTRPLTVVEKRWLKAISLDPRIGLFDVEFPELSDVQPLFTKEDYRIYDAYSDGDPFTDADYIRNFRTVLRAIKEKKPIEVRMRNRREREIVFSCTPLGMEYSLKDDKIRVLGDRCKFRYFNLGRVCTCCIYEGNVPLRKTVPTVQNAEIFLEITDERNALERCMLHFAHFEKQVQRIDDVRYSLHLIYESSDETEILIRVLSFGPCVRVTAPAYFSELIRERLCMQRRCGTSDEKGSNI